MLLRCPQTFRHISIVLSDRQKNYNDLYVGQSICTEFSMKKRGPGHSEKVGPDKIFIDSLLGMRFSLKI